MAYLAPIPPQLQQVEYVKLYFHLQFRDSFDLPQAAWLQLRRELLQARRTLEGRGNCGESALLQALFHPALSSDPSARRLAQQPAPAFVLRPDLQISGLLSAGRRIVLPALFVGRGVQAADAFVTLLEQLGRQGFYKGTGRFLLEGVESENASGVRAMLWSGGKREPLAPPSSDLSWLLERMPHGDEATIELTTPLRLVHNKKPLFRADFATIFPFIMRRVAAMTVSHSGVEMISDPHLFLDIAGRIEQVENRLYWHDWRELSGAQRSQNLGGLLGRIRVAGPALAELFWLLQLASLFNLGKGAAYGGGQLELKPL